MKKIANYILKIMVSLLLGGLILYWMYRDFDFSQIKEVLFNGMDWTWMLLSLPFGILAQLLRGMRWRQTLEPIGEHPRMRTCLNSIFMSYAVSLVIPRIGEFARCAMLKRCDGVSFSKSLGTVVTERIIDSLLVMLLTGLTLLFQLKVFNVFFDKTGTNIVSTLRTFSSTGYIVTAICALAVVFLAVVLLRRLSFFNKVKSSITGLWQGVMSLRSVKNVPLFIFFTLGIWLSYFIHYYLTFFCFDATSHLGVSCAMVTFVVGSIAVIVPTPNGAGPWHFAVKTMLILYGVAETDALFFVLIVHSVQTLLVVLLGIYSWMSLMFTEKRRDADIQGKDIHNLS